MLATRPTSLRRFAASVLVAIVALLGAAHAMSHETWLLPTGARFEAPGRVTLALTSGMVFPKPDTALPAERLAQSGVRLRGETVSLEPIQAVGGALLLRADLKRTGVATAWLEIPPLPVELTPKLVEEYFEEIQADPEVRRAWATQEPKLWRERYAKFAKTIMRVGKDDGSDRSWAEPIGGSLEVIPETDPTLLGPDARLTVRVLKFGKPLAALMLAAQYGGEHDWQRTDSAGRASFVLRGNGPWLIHGTELRRAQASDYEWESWFTTLTIGRQ